MTRRSKAAQVTEAALLQTVLDTCRHMRLLAYHTYRSTRSPSGFPDLVVTGPGGTVFRELKTETGVVSAAQQIWLDTLRLAGSDADVWRPADLASQRIIRELRALTKARAEVAT